MAFYLQSQQAQNEIEGVSPDDISDTELLEYIEQNNPQVYEQLMALSVSDQVKALQMMRNAKNDNAY